MDKERVDGQELKEIEEPGSDERMDAKAMGEIESRLNVDNEPDPPDEVV